MLSRRSPHELQKAACGSNGVPHLGQQKSPEVLRNDAALEVLIVLQCLLFQGICCWMSDKDYSIVVPLSLVVRFDTISQGYMCFLSMRMIQLI